MPVSREAFERAGGVIDAGVQTALAAAKAGSTPGDVASILVDALLEDPRFDELDTDDVIKGALTLAAVAVVQIAQDSMQLERLYEKAGELRESVVRLGQTLGLPIPEDLLS